jgi:O-antigen/teichoic acid export membrane protein
VTLLKGLTRTVAIQGTGIAALLLANLIVARLGGPALQGRFYAIKSINDFQVAFLGFGLPAGIVYYINKTGTGARLFHRLSWRYAALIALPLIAVDYVALTHLLPESPGSFNDAALVAIGSAAFIAYSIQRGIILTQNDGDLFSSLTATSSYLYLVLLPLSVLADLAPIASAYFIVGLLCVGLSDLVIRRLRLPAHEGELRAIDWRLVLAQSNHVFLQGLLFGLQPLLTIHLMQWHGADGTIVGLFNIAALVFILPNLLTAMVAPVFYNRWSKSLDRAGLFTVAKRATAIAGGAQILALASWPLVEPATALVFGEEFRAAAPAIKILLFGVGALTFTRIMSPAFQGMGQNVMLTLSCLLRLAPLLALAFLRVEGPLANAALCWLAGEWLAALSLGMALSRATLDQR